MLEKEIAQQIKQKIKEQILNWEVDETNKNKTIAYIESLNEKELEDFLIRNDLLKKQDSEDQKTSSKECIFCDIAQKKIQSYVLEENEDYLVVLEINPFSKAHSLIIPKKHCSVEEIPPSCFNSVNRLSKIIKLSFSPKEIEISTASNFNHAVINLIPVYENQENKRKPAKKEELEKLAKIISQNLSLFKKQKKTEKNYKEKILNEEKDKFPIRIP